MGWQQERRRADEIAAAYERWSYAEGVDAGRVDGGRQGFRDGYTLGWDGGVEAGAVRALAALEHAIGRERLDELVAAAGDRLPVSAWRTYRERTTYTAPADHVEWRGLENGERLPTWEPVREQTDDDGDGLG